MIDNLSAYLKTVTRLTFFFLSVCCVCWAVFPAQQAWWGGLVIGTIASLVNALHLGWKVIRIGENAAAGGNRRSTLGYVTRACIGVLAAVIATRTFDFRIEAVAAGLIVAQLATLLLGFWTIRKRERTQSLDERGENN
ncbi:ATP synthase I [Paenibacillus curdlanolyticus YK9]|uniref:ATP synthase I n=1 Tax=Paenibacillus curdlanolyticus YK9 TaxID=717606 RepID=E0IEK5_9BACL|nr:ATP synthase subunit I [Paenibacillus curdlanolyticus]EFM09093.1 ATP synthase I [Paenibacillus curdlanolyticus YK9]